MIAKNLAACKHRVIANRNRIQDLDKLIARAYEDNVLGRIDDERYRSMTAEFEKEQRELKEQQKKDEAALQNASQEKVDLHVFLDAIRECIDLKELNGTIVNTLIQRIEVFNPVKVNGKRHVPVKIYFTAVGVLDIPDEDEILRIMCEISKDKKASV